MVAIKGIAARPTTLAEFLIWTLANGYNEAARAA